MLELAGPLVDAEKLLQTDDVEALLHGLGAANAFGDVLPGHLDMNAAGIWIARRGFVALNIMIGDAEGDRFVAAVEEFVTARQALLRPQ